MHQDSSFVTLTYSPEHVSKTGSLVPRDVQLWLKRLRKLAAPQRIRYFLCGEYGDQSERPHYHAALFGLSMAHSSLVTSSWPLGYAMCAEFNAQTAQYISGYVTKKTMSLGSKILNGRYPEFARMSRRPGIGVPALDVIAQALKSQRMEDVPHVLMLGTRKFPLARFLRLKLREIIGHDEDGILPSSSQFRSEASIEVYSLFKAALVRRAEGDKTAPLTVRDAIVEANQGRIWSVEAKARIQRGRKL